MVESNSRQKVLHLSLTHSERCYTLTVWSSGEGKSYHEFPRRFESLDLDCVLLLRRWYELWDSGVSTIVCHAPKISLRDGIFPKRLANLTTSVMQCRSTNLLSTLLTNVSTKDEPISCSRYRGSNSGSTAGSEETECWGSRSEHSNVNSKKTYDKPSWEWMIQTNGDREVPLIEGRWI